MRRKSEYPSRTSALAATLVGLVFLSCSPSSPTDPGQTQGQIQVNVSTSGTGVPSSFTVTLDGDASRSVSPDGSVTYGSLNPGNYTVELDVPGNCTISGSAERSVGVQEGSTSTVAYSVSCSAIPRGAIGVTTSTTGSPPDPDGYTVSVDGGAATPIGVNDNLLVPDLGLGDHELELSGVAANCLVQGANPRTVSVSENQTTQTEFDVTCSATSGRIDVSVTTTGQALDADGYDVELDDGAATREVDTNGSAEFMGVEQGEHTLTLVDIASNCVVAGDNPVAVEVVAGEAVDASFTVECEATTGGLQVSATTTGDEPDSNGYAVSVDGSLDQSIGVNGSTTFPDLPPGDHEVELEDVAGNCTVAGENPRILEITAGETASTTFDVTCSATVGGIRVTATTTGETLDEDGYSVVLDGGADTELIDENGDTVTFGGLAPGEYDLQLGNVADNCSVTSDNPATATVTAGQTTDVAFTVECEALTGSIQVNVSTSGENEDTGYLVALLPEDTEVPIGADGSHTFTSVVVGEYDVELRGVADNCGVQGSNPRTVDVSDGVTAQVSFDVECLATAGQIEVTVTTTGVDLDPNGYTVDLDGSSSEAVNTNGSTEFTGVSEGPHTLTLENFADNCEPVDNPLMTNVTAGETAEVNFTVECAQIVGDIRVNMTTTGVDQDTEYTATLSGGQGSRTVPANGSTTFPDVPVGNYTVTISGIATNCTDDGGDNQESVTVSANTTADANFSYTCEEITGSVQVNMTTTGVDLDTQYTATLSGGQGSQTVSANGSTTFDDVPVDDYTVTISGIAANCTDDGGDNEEPVTVTEDATANANFSYTCTSTTGSIDVDVSTSGVDLDPNGYTIRLNGGTPRTVGINGGTTYSALTPGDYDVGIDESTVADNCAINEVNPHTENVTAANTSTVTFTVTCEQITGSVAVNMTTTGVDQDTEYTATLSGGQGSQTVPANGTATFNNVPVGNYTVTISGIAANCTDDDGDNQEPATVAEDATANANFSYTCTSTTGAIDVDVSTSGVDPDPNGYTIRLNGGTPQTVGINGSTTYSALTPGDYDVGIDETTVADNCDVNETNPHTESVTEATTSAVTFTVTCEEITGSIMVTTTTTGTPDPNGYLVALDGGPTMFIDDANPVTFDDLQPVSHDVALSGFDGTCTLVAPPSSPATPTVIAGETASVDFNVDCA